MDPARRKIVITGVSKGLGQALSREFVRAGHQVFGCGRSKSAVAQLQEELPAGHFSIVDVTQASAVHAWAQQIEALTGSVDLLINNAGLINRPAPLWQLSAAEFSRVFDVNVNGVIHVLHAFLPNMLETRKGVIVNVSSSWGREAEAGLSPYCASKFAVEGLTQALAKELPGGLAAVSLDPGGGINTDMLKHSLGDEAEQFPTADAWAQRAAPFLLALSALDNGKALTVSA